MFWRYFDDELTNSTPWKEDRVSRMAQVTQRANSALCDTPRKRDEGVIELWYRKVNCISSRLHRDSVCPVDCETSERHNYFTTTARKRKSSKREWKKKARKRRSRYRANESRARLARYLIHVKVRGEVESFTYKRKRDKDGEEKRERRSNRRKRVAERAAGWTVSVFPLTATRVAANQFLRLGVTLVHGYVPYFCVSGRSLRVCLHV